MPAFRPLPAALLALALFAPAASALPVVLPPMTQPPAPTSDDLMSEAERTQRRAEHTVQLVRDENPPPDAEVVVARALATAERPPSPSDLEAWGDRVMADAQGELREEEAFLQAAHATDHQTAEAGLAFLDQERDEASRIVDAGPPRLHAIYDSTAADARLVADRLQEVAEDPDRVVEGLARDPAATVQRFMRGLAVPGELGNELSGVKAKLAGDFARATGFAFERARAYLDLLRSAPA